MQTTATTDATTPFDARLSNMNYPSPSPGLFGQVQQHQPQQPSQPQPGFPPASQTGKPPFMNGNVASPLQHAASPFTQNHASPNGYSHHSNSASPARATSPPKSSSAATHPFGANNAQSQASSSSSSGPKRKKQKIEYVPWSKPVADNIGGYSIMFADDIFNQAYQKARRRTVHDLGNVDFVTLRLSLQSGLATEIVPVLNSLNILADALRTSNSPQDPGVGFNQSQMDDVSALFEALIDYLADRAFLISTDDSPSHAKGKGKSPAGRPHAPDNYEDLWVLATQSELQLQPTRKRKHRDVLPAPEVILSIVNILRSFSFSFDLTLLMVKHTRMLDLVLRLCDFPLGQSPASALDKEGRPLRSPIPFSWSDLLTIRKDVVVMLSELGLQIELDQLPRRCARQTFDLIFFFLSQPTDVDLPGSYGSSPLGRTGLRKGSYGTFTEAALSALTQVAARDSNREVLGSLGNSAQIFEQFEALLQCLPVLDEEYEVLIENHSQTLPRLEKLALSLYHLAFLAPTDVKNRIRQRPGFAQVMVSVVARFQAQFGLGHPQAAQYQVLCTRLLETVNILSKSADAAESYYDPLAPFFGGAFAGGVSGERREMESQSEKRLRGEPVEAPRAEELSSLTFQSPGVAEMLAQPSYDPVVYTMLAKLL